METMLPMETMEMMLLMEVMETMLTDGGDVDDKQPDDTWEVVDKLTNRS